MGPTCQEVSCLPQEIWTLVLDQLTNHHLPSLAAFRAASRACRNLADATFYRDIHLEVDCYQQRQHARLYRPIPAPPNPGREGAKDRKDWPVEEKRLSDQQNWLSDRLQDPEDSLSQHVRRLTIGQVYSEPDYLQEDTIVSILQSVKHITDFSWNSKFEMPLAVIESLRQSWPECRVHIGVPYAPDYEEYNRLSSDLLSLPGITSLDVNIPVKDYSHPNADVAVLETALKGNKILESLSIRGLTYDDSRRNQVTHLDPRVLDSGIALRFLTLFMPNLETSQYQGFAEGRDWTHLHTLDMQHHRGDTLLELLEDKVSQLKTFRIKLTHHIDTFLNFVDSVDGIEEFVCKHADSVLYWKTFWPRFLARHGPSLRRLVLPRYMAWNVSSLRDLLKHAPRLTELGVELELGQVTNINNHTFWPLGSQNILAQFKSLTRLSLAVPIESGPSHLTERGERFLLHLPEVERVLTGLFDAFLAENVTCLLEHIDAVFYRPGQDSINWRYNIDRTLYPVDDRSPYKISVIERGDRKSEHDQSGYCNWNLDGAAGMIMDESNRRWKREQSLYYGHEPRSVAETGSVQKPKKTRAKRKRSEGTGVRIENDGTRSLRLRPGELEQGTPYDGSRFDNYLCLQ